MNTSKLPYRWVVSVFLVVMTQNQAHSTAQPDSKGIEWQPWRASVFAEAKREHKFVLLDLQAVWCHWCHVMDDKTYSDPRVIALIKARYLPVRVDQDSRPDLASRYEDYGWPATVVYNSEGGEIVKRSGFFPPEQMISMLQAIIADPSPGPSVLNDVSIPSNGTAFLSNGLRQTLRQQFEDGYDWKMGSWGFSQKFLNWDNVEYCLVRAQQGDVVAAKQAHQTLQAQRELIDPIWGGVDQYSTNDDWSHPHFEKIMLMQAENLRIYARAYAVSKNPIYLESAESIYGYVRGFLTGPEDVVYVSQDADLVPGQHSADYFKLGDAARRKLGVPRLDRHIYSRENGWFIEALTSLYSATGNSKYLEEAVRAADWILKNRSVTGGGFRHGDEKTDVLYLADNLAMARACLCLYEITGDSSWRARAEKTALFIARSFRYQADGVSVGFATAANEPSAGQYAPQPGFDENVSLARFCNLLFHATGNHAYRQMAETAMRFVTAPAIAQSQKSSVGGLLLADLELGTDPLHVAIVGARKNENADGLFQTATAHPIFYKEVEWIDPSELFSLDSKIPYPKLPRAAAYLCTGQSCSPPVFDRRILLQLLGQKNPSTITGL